MKLILLIPFIILPLCSCATKLDCKAGTYSTMGDNTMVRIDAWNGQITHYECASNNHSAVTRANWHGLGTLAGQAAAFGAGPAMGAGVVGLTQILNRPTSRPITNP